MENENLKLVIAMARAHDALFSKIEMNVKEYGLTLSEFGVLEMLFHKGEQPVQKVAEKILVTSGTITYVIDKLQQRELVSRQKCTNDKRVYYVCLTPKGTALIADIFPRHEAFLQDSLKGMTQKKKDALINHLITLQEALNHQASL
ncbi:MAG: MarR family transcriptional regulator [Bacillota bacterium]|nr:MarR family transcriptional regulator [Bacillota bacterium]